MYIIYKYVKHIYIGDFMISLKDKLIYCLVLVVFLISGVTFGYFQTRFSSGISVNNESLLDYARDYAFNPNMKEAVSVSTKTYDIEVVYEDDYSGCGESVTNSKMEYGTTIDEVKEKEKKYQEENGLNYDIKAEGTNRIIYARTLNGNCPNHFLVILENGKINVYSIQSEDNKTVYMTIDNVNVDYLREELKEKVEKGTYINSREELNLFIEDLES